MCHPLARLCSFPLLEVALQCQFNHAKTHLVMCRPSVVVYVFADPNPENVRFTSLVKANCLFA
jgi:hypothetical protein